MKRFGTILLVGVAVLLLVPAFMRSSPSSQLGPGVVVMTPHNEQIRFELGSRFSQWHHPMKFLVLSTSLSPSSRSRILARAAFERLPDVHESTWMDLHTEGLPLCDGGPAADERVDRLRRAVAGCDGILITFGIYNYLAPAATKNAVEWAGRAAFEGKVVAFAAVGGGPGSLPCVASLTTPMLPILEGSG